MLITGLGWEETLVLETRSGQGKRTWPVAKNDRFDFRFSDDRSCIGYRSPGSVSLVPCPDEVTSIASSQCASCFDKAKILPCLRCDGSFCRNPARRHECVSERNHALYIAAFSDRHLKVGVAKWNRRTVRLAEQGAKAALIVARDDGQMIRRSETMMKKLGVPDRIAPSEKLKAHALNCSNESMIQALKDTLSSLKARMRAEWITPETFSRAYENMAGVRILSAGGISLDGEVHDLVGQIIAVKDGTGEIVAVDGASLIGRRMIRSSGANYQMSLSGQLGA